MKNYPAFLQTELIQRLLEISSEHNWPPQEWMMQNGEPGIPFLWNPSELEGVSGDLVKIHSLVILRELGKRGGVACPIDLYEWFWKDVLVQYLSVLPAGPEGLRIPRNSTNTESEKIKDALDPETLEASGDILDSLDSMDGPDGVFKKLYDPSLPRHPLVYWRLGVAPMEDILPQKLKERLFDVALQLRIKLWWGWPSASFCCIESIITNAVRILIEDEVLTLVDNEHFYPPKLARYRLSKKGREILFRQTPSGTNAQLLQDLVLSKKSNKNALDFWSTIFFML